MAKQKYESIAVNVGSADLALDQERANQVRREAEELMRQLEKEHPSLPFVEGQPEEVPSNTPKAITFLENQEAQTANEDAKKNFWHWPKFNFPFPSPPKTQLQKPLRSSGLPADISDGEALYKVAVSDGKVTIQETVDVAMANNLQLVAAKKNLEVADAKLTETKRAFYPTVQAVAEVNGGHVPGAITPTINAQRFYKGENQKINFTQPLYYGGELTNTLKQAEENLRAAKSEYKKASNDFVHQVRVAYYGVVKSEYNAQYQVELFDRVRQIFKQVKEEQRQKLTSELEALSTESYYYQTLYQVEASKNDVVSANVALHQVMNMDSEAPVPVDLKLDFFQVKADVRNLIARALQNNADLRTRVFALESARYGVDIYESKQKPHFELRGSYGQSGEAFHDDKAFDTLDFDPAPGGLRAASNASNNLAKEWFLGIHGSMPLGPNTVEYEQTKHQYGPTVLALTGSDDWKHHVAFNLFDRFSAITDEKSAEYAYLQAQSDYQEAKNDVTLKVRNDYYDLQKYLIQIDSSIAKTRYQEKQNSILEYLLGLQEATASQYVQNLIEQAQNKYAFIQAVADYNTALSSLSVSIGDPEYFDYGSQPTAA